MEKGAFALWSKCSIFHNIFKYMIFQSVKRRYYGVKGYVYLQVSTADNLCKQFGPRSGPTKLLVLIWIQTVLLSGSIPEMLSFKKQTADYNKA